MSGINYSSVIKDLKISHRGILTWIQGLGGICTHVCACFDGGFVWLPLKPGVESVPIRDSRVRSVTTAAEQKQRESFDVFIYFSDNSFRIAEAHMKQWSDISAAHLKVQILNLIAFVFVLTTCVRAPTGSRSHPCKAGALGAQMDLLSDIWHMVFATSARQRV